MSKLHSKLNSNLTLSPVSQLPQNLLSSFVPSQYSLPLSTYFCISQSIKYQILFPSPTFHSIQLSSWFFISVHYLYFLQYFPDPSPSLDSKESSNCSEDIHSCPFPIYSSSHSTVFSKQVWQCRIHVYYPLVCTHCCISGCPPRLSPWRFHIFWSLPIAQVHMHILLLHSLGFNTVNFFQILKNSKLLLAMDPVLCACNVLNILH